MHQFFRDITDTLYPFQRTLNQRKRSAELMRNICKKDQFVLSQLFLHTDTISQTAEITDNPVSKVQSDHDQQSITEESPSCFPERRLDHNSQSCLLIIPNTSLIARLHMQDIRSGIQIFIGSKTK